MARYQKRVKVPGAKRYQAASTVYYVTQGAYNLQDCELKTLVRDHLNESYWAVLSCGTVYYAVQGDSNF